MIAPILHIGRDLPPPAQGGVSIALWALRAALAEHGVVQATLSFDQWRPIRAGVAAAVDSAAATVTATQDAAGRVWRLSRPAQLAAALELADAWLQLHPGALVVCHADLLIDVALELRQRRRLAGDGGERVALVAHVLQRSQRLLHGLEAPTASEVAQQRALLVADVVVAPSDWAADVLRELLDAAGAEIGADVLAALVVAPPPAAPVVAATAGSGWSTAAATGLHLVYLGRFDAIKGFDVLLQALPDLLRRHASLRVTLAGGLPLASKGERRWRRQIDAVLAPVPDGSVRVDLPGFLAHDAAMALLATADVVVVPSRIETYGQVAAEAMRLGRCVVASAAGALGARLRDEVDALLVPAADAAALTAAIERALGDAALRQRLGTAAMQSEAARPDAVQAWLALAQASVRVRQGSA